MLVLLASPLANGVTDRLGLAAAQGAGGARIIKLSDYEFSPCRGCGKCKEDGICIYKDACGGLFDLLMEAGSLIIAAPVYFYALPAQFKALIDRSQIFWRNCQGQWPLRKQAGVIMAAGRPVGEKLFAGSLLTLKYFLKPFAFEITQTLLLRGLENVKTLDNNPEYGQQAEALGLAIAQNSRQIF